MSHREVALKYHSSSLMQNKKQLVDVKENHQHDSACG